VGGGGGGGGGGQFSRLLAAEVCASAVVMLDTPCSEVVSSVLATHSIRQFPLHFPSRASPCAITFQLVSNTGNEYNHDNHTLIGTFRHLGLNDLYSSRSIVRVIKSRRARLARHVARVDWVGPTAGLDGCGKSRHHPDSIPAPLTRSESLYRLSYPSQ